MSKIKKVSITEEELSKLKNVGHGSYATVFADEEKKIAIKKYYTYVNNLWEFGRNPCLDIKERYYKRLNTRDKRIKYTDTFVELVYKGCRFIGVKKKYYEGISLDKIGSRTLTEKKEILTKLIRNAEELAFHKIYNLDYRSNNVLVTNDGEVKILDLDDVWTKVTLLPNPIYERKSRWKLQQTIINVIYDYQSFILSYMTKKITSSPKNNPRLQKQLSYKQLQDLVESVNFEKKIIIINEKEIYNLNINLLKNYMTDNDLVLVLAINTETSYWGDRLKDIFSYLDNQNICVYDVFEFKENYEEARQNYINSHETTDLHVYEDDFKVLKKK